MTDNEKARELALRFGDVVIEIDETGMPSPPLNEADWRGEVVLEAIDWGRKQERQRVLDEMRQLIDKYSYPSDAWHAIEDYLRQTKERT